MYSLWRYPIHLFPFLKTGAKRNGEDGFPHSEIHGSTVAHTSPQLIAACHVLHRLCMPRHPPNALTSHLRVHTTNDNAELQEHKSLLFAWHVTELVMWIISISAFYSRILSFKDAYCSNIIPINAIGIDTTAASISKTHLRCQRSGQCPRIRLRRNFMSSDLEKLVEPIGIEPMTSCLQSRRSPS